MINVLYFARLREQLQTESEQLEVAPEITNVAALTDVLRNRGGVWAEAFGGSTVMAAVNQEVANPSTSISDGDEVAFFPPVTGG
jgi:molybdopterin synthase sulfur carrier subunit